jgi:hypothetical protein
MRAALFLSLFTLSQTTARATVQELLRACDSPMTSPPFSFCLGYVSGIGDALVVNRLLHIRSTDVLGAEICGDPNPSHGAEIQAFRNWAHGHPERWIDPEYSGVIEALMDLWPCSR